MAEHEQGVLGIVRETMGPALGRCSNPPCGWISRPHQWRARQPVRTAGGVCVLDRERVRVDVWDFLDAQRLGNRARAAGRHGEAVAAFEPARALYAGPLLLCPW